MLVHWRALAMVYDTLIVEAKRQGGALANSPAPLVR